MRQNHISIANHIDMSYYYPFGGTAGLASKLSRAQRGAQFEPLRHAAAPKAQCLLVSLKERVKTRGICAWLAQIAACVDKVNDRLHSIRARRPPSSTFLVSLSP